MRVLITGTSRGIGLEFTRQYLKHEHQVLACCRTPDTADRLQALKTLPGRLVVIPMDVADDASIQAALETVSRQVTGLDVLINNAGVFPTAERNLDTFDAETMLRTFRINTVAPLAIAQRFRALLKSGVYPRLVSIGSAAGSFGALQSKPATGHYSYRCSKTALHMATCLLAAELKQDNITVVTLRPGWVRTDMTSHEGDLTPEQSVSGMIRVIDQLTPADSGAFRTWEGREYPW